MAAKKTKAPVRETAADALRRLLLEQFAEAMKNEPRAARGSVEGLHDVRVAFRRMRSLTTTFAQVSPKYLARLDRLASKVCDRMGDARDIDVWIGLFMELDRAGGTQGLAAGEKRKVLAELREARTKLAAGALGCSAYAKAKKMLRDLAGKNPFRGGSDGPGVEKLAARRILVVREMVEQRHRQVGSFASEAAHRLRRSARRMRYLSEFFAQKLGAESVRAGRWITKAQASLGKMHDIDSALEFSRELPSGKARAEVRRKLKERRKAHLDGFKTAWRHYADSALQAKWRKRLETLSRS